MQHLTRVPPASSQRRQSKWCRHPPASSQRRRRQGGCDTSAPSPTRWDLHAPTPVRSPHSPGRSPGPGSGRARSPFARIGQRPPWAASRLEPAPPSQLGSEELATRLQLRAGARSRCLCGSILAARASWPAGQGARLPVHPGQCRVHRWLRASWLGDSSRCKCCRRRCDPAARDASRQAALPTGPFPAPNLQVPPPARCLLQAAA